jgi:hypothetical protein
VTIGGDDPRHDLPAKEKDALEAQLRAEARVSRRKRKIKEANRMNSRAIEISRKKSKRAHKGTD